jgi:hypothetical protein
MRERGGQRVWTFLALPWNAFVGAFVYYTLLAVLTVSGLDLSAPFIVAAYAMPLAFYLAMVLVRAARAIASVPIDLFHAPRALAR